MINEVEANLRAVVETGLAAAIRQELAAFNHTLADMRAQSRRELLALQSVVGRMLMAGIALPSITATFQQATIHQVNYGLEQNDSTVYATIIADLVSKPAEELACFVSRDKRAFSSRAIGAELGGYNCRYISTFEHGLQYISSQVGGGTP